MPSEPGEGELERKIATAIEDGEIKRGGGWLDYFSIEVAAQSVMSVFRKELQARDARMAFYREQWTAAAYGQTRDPASVTVAKAIAKWESEQAAKKGGKTNAE